MCPFTRLSQKSQINFCLQFLSCMFKFCSIEMIEQLWKNHHIKIYQIIHDFGEVFSFPSPILYLYLTPLTPLSVRPFVRLSVRPSGKITVGSEGPQPSTGAQKKPPIGGLHFPVIHKNNYAHITRPSYAFRCVHSIYVDTYI